MTGKTYRLLSEAEWEYASRGGATTAYPWGNEVGSGNADCNGCGSQWDAHETSPAGSFKPNGFGLFDMDGDVWQWVEDCYHPDYVGAPSNGVPWISGDCSRRVYRGGSWYSLPRYVRSANRSMNATGYRVNLVGFRIARTLSIGRARADWRRAACSVGRQNPGHRGHVSTASRNFAHARPHPRVCTRGQRAGTAFSE